MKLYLCEKPSQAADIAKVLGSARKTGTYWETDGGRVTWCFGHLLELCAPEGYDPKLKEWRFADLPILPDRFRYEPKADAAGQLRAIGGLLSQSDTVVIATDADREGEMIGREVLAYHRYTGPVDRLWLSALDEESIRKALARLKPGADTLPLYHAALARSEADWLVGMNMSRAMTLKTGSGDGVVSVGRVQTPTVALVVRRDLAIKNHQPRDYFELVAQVRADNGTEVKLMFAPRDEAQRIWDRAKAEALAKTATGQHVTLHSQTTDKRKAPPALFSLSGLQKRANALWGWTADKTLKVAQSLYETHKATTYPRTDCEFLPEEQLGDAAKIAANLIGLPAFKHLAKERLEPRKAVFNTAKVSAHHAIIPTKVAPPLGAMDADEQQAYFLIASHYLASLLPDYEYKSTKISTTAAGVELSVTGTTPGLPGWRRVFTTGGATEKEEVETLPAIPDGTGGQIDQAKVETKQTEPPPAYTEGTLIEDMKSVAKFVTDPAKKSRLKESSGIGTEATRANILKTIKDRGYVEAKGKLIVSTAKGRSFVATLESELPALADPGETAVWEEGLEAVASGTQTTNTFISAIGGRMREYLAVLGKKADVARAAKTGHGVALTGKATGVRIGAAELMDYGEFYQAAGVNGRIYKNVAGHKLTPPEVVRLVAGKATIEVQDCSSRNGTPVGPKKLRYNPDRKPYAGVEVVGAEAVATAVASPRKSSGTIQDCGDYFTVPGYESSGRSVRFWKTVAGRPISADELAEILAAKDAGVRMGGFRKGDGTPFKADPIVRYNARKKPYPGLEFEFEQHRETVGTVRQPRP
jgi:DNA topoisomerase III